MLPTAYEFHWDLAHIVFLGIFYGVVTFVVCSLAVAFRRWLGDLGQSRMTAIDWHESFCELPLARRHCRHEYDGAVTSRLCDNEFDCAGCERHREFLAAPKQAPAVAPVGMGVDADNFHHRGHLQVRPGDDGTMTVGLDEFARRCYGECETVDLPAPGDEIEAGQRCVELGRGDLRARLAAPLGGRVIAVGAADDDWLYRLQPSRPGIETRNLLRGDEARVWMLRELEWLQGRLSPDCDLPALADGGELVDDFMAAYPGADWDDIWAQVCLQA